jgi:pyruvate dehydrogenase E1 component
MYYKEDRKGQILEEGINEAGAVCSWLAAGTAYSNHGVNTIPFYIFYSMFGFQRVGDFIWAAGDSQARGFLMGGTAGRTTLAGEGLQHQDGHSHLAAAAIPNCLPYDPTYAYELAVIIQDGLRRMYREQEHVFYYITVMNENYTHPPLPRGVEEGILKGMYLLEAGEPDNPLRVQLLGSGTILREVIAAARLLAEDFGVSADIWSVPSYTLLRRDGLAVARWNLLHPGEPPRRSHVEQCLAAHPGPVVAASDYLKSHADQIRPLLGRTAHVLGTDGYGRSDTREKLRQFFEVDRHYVVVAALHALADDDRVPASTVNEAIRKYGIDPDKPEPVTV